MSRTSKEDWRELATALREHGGVPKRRAQAVALRAAGLTYREIADELGLADHSTAWEHVTDYQKMRDAAEWLAEHGPDVSSEEVPADAD